MSTSPSPPAAAPLPARKLQLGILVASLDATIASLERVLGLGPFRFLDVPEAGVRAAFTDWAGVEIELLEAANDEVAQAHAAFLKGRPARLQHVGAYVPDVDAAVGRLRGERVRMLIDDLAAETGRAALADLRSEAGFLLELVEAAR